jgi:hypothetical protein
MALLSGLLDRVHDEMPTVPKAIALRALSDATREFCSRSHYWQELQPPLPLLLNVSIYDVPQPTGKNIVAIKDMRYNGTKVFPVVTDNVRIQPWRNPPGAPAAYYQLTPAAFELTRAPDVTGDLVIIAAVTLAFNTVDTPVPDMLVQTYGEALASGAKMRLCMQAGQDWANLPASSIYGAPYYAAINEAKAKAKFALGEADAQVAMRPWV